LIQHAGSNSDLQAYCKLIGIGDEILLYDFIPSNKGGYYYWLCLKADAMPLIVCALEKYVDANSFGGRKADYFCMGWHEGTCYIIIIELRETLIKTSHFDDKVEQIKQTIHLITSNLLANISESSFFKDACDTPDEYKIVGAIIPATRSMARTHQSVEVGIGEERYFIAAVPYKKIRECRISWSELLSAIGL
jgi:hypothetical protein